MPLRPQQMPGAEDDECLFYHRQLVNLITHVPDKMLLCHLFILLSECFRVQQWPLPALRQTETLVCELPPVPIPEQWLPWYLREQR